MQDAHALGAHIVLGRYLQGALEQQLRLVPTPSGAKYAAPRVERVDECLGQTRHFGYLQRPLCTLKSLVEVTAKIELLAELGGDAGDVGFAPRVIRLSG